MKDAPSDADLIERSQREPGCFVGIFDRHGTEILRYAHARLGPDLAEDITAETFLAAFRRRDTYDTSRADTRPWLYGIAVRLIGKHRRSEARYQRMLQSQVVRHEGLGGPAERGWHRHPAALAVRLRRCWPAAGAASRRRARPRALPGGN